MKKLVLFFFLFSLSVSFSQNMTNAKLDTLFTTLSDSIQGNTGRWQLQIKETPIICITDSTHNRMRIMSPIIEAYKLTEELKTNALVANFHTALDVKYAIADDVLWSVFIHPLKELNNEQVIDAIKQVYFANVTFGTTYSSTTLVFPGRETQDTTPKKEKEDIIKRKI